MASPNIWKNEINRLNQEELKYEMLSRGLQSGSVESNRKSLRNILKLENKGDWSQISYPIKFEDDITQINKNNSELKKLVSEFDGNTKSSHFARLTALLTHNMRRIQHSDPGTDDTNVSLKNTALLELHNIKTDCEKLFKKFNRPSNDSSSNFVEPITNSSPNNSDSGSEGDDIFQSTPVPQQFSPKSIPVLKWNLKFSGDDSMSLSAFLQRVEELRKARNVSIDEVFRAGYDLFCGKALTWFRENIKHASDWPSLVKLLREEFQPADYDERLYDEIKSRTQGSSESIGIYIAIMDNLFSRLPVTIPENKQLKILT